jgi:protein-disulfide isomerase
MNAQRDDRSKNREAAREKAKAMRLAGSARERRNRLFLQLGLGAVALLVIGTLVAVISTAFKPEGPGPLNMASDGIKIGQNGVAVSTPALQPGKSPTATPANKAGVVDITIFVDYMCPYCGAFEQTNMATIDELLSRGVATLEVHPMAFVNTAQGLDYSTRAANAAACVANYAPNSYLKFHNLLYTNQPAENTPGLSNDELATYAQQAGAASTISDCINNGEFDGWVAGATLRAQNGDIAVNKRDASFDKVHGTPTILINGKPVEFAQPYKQEDFLNAVLAAASKNQ